MCLALLLKSPMVLMYCFKTLSPSFNMAFGVFATGYSLSVALLLISVACAESMTAISSSKCD